MINGRMDPGEADEIIDPEKSRLDELRREMARVESELTDVEAALERLENGTYGTCEVCGRPIEDSRLEAWPATRFCAADSPEAP